MPDQAVVNASPLIFLAKAGMIHFLQQAAPHILAPVAVAHEISRRGRQHGMFLSESIIDRVMLLIGE